jgi:hypothetical protein
MAFSILTLVASIFYFSASLSNASPVGPGPFNPGAPIPISPDANSAPFSYTRVSFMNDNSLIAGYAATAAGPNGTETVLRVARSTDSAQSWQPLGEIFRALTAEHDINNAFPMQLPSGRVIYAYRNHDRTGTDLHYTWFRISISYSDDGGKSWLYLSTVIERAPQGVNGLWEPFLRIARDGSIQCYYSSESASNVQVVLMQVSKDGGVTWGTPISVAGGGSLISRDGMVGVAPVDNDGNLM